MVTSFGQLDERPTLIVEVLDDAGNCGWGEVWCNFPQLVAEHRLAFLTSVVAPMLEGQRLERPEDAGQRLDRTFGVQAIQAGEEGTLASIAAGIDQALWDLIARRQEQPLWKVLGGRRSVRVCASGIDPTRAEETIRAQLQLGHTAFKIKVGFDDATDVGVVRDMRAAFGESIDLMVDANQAWSLRHAVEVANALAEYRPLWIEEPIRASEPLRTWQELAARTSIPLATGENIRSEQSFKEIVSGGFVKHVQPDVGKWGGLSGCTGLGRWAVAARLSYSPHWAGGGIGLAHSLAALSAVGGDGYAEVDVTANPLRDAFFVPSIVNGTVVLPEEPGVGFVPRLASSSRVGQASAVVSRAEPRGAGVCDAAPSDADAQTMPP